MSAQATPSHRDCEVPIVVPEPPLDLYQSDNLDGEAFVILLHPPPQLGSAMDRCSWDMVYKGLGTQIGERSGSSPPSPVQSVRHSDVPYSPTTTAYDSDARSMSSYHSEGTPPTSEDMGSDSEAESHKSSDVILSSVPRHGHHSRFANFPGDGKYVKLANVKTTKAGRELTLQVFSVSIVVEQGAPDNTRFPELARVFSSGDHTTFVAIPDTGSDTTWFAGYKSMRLELSADDPRDASKDKIVLKPHRSDNNHMDSALWEYDDRFAHPKPAGILCGRVQYVNRMAAYIVKVVRNIEFNRETVFQWKNGVSWESVLKLNNFPAGAASAMTTSARKFAAKAILGMGPSDVQQMFDFAPDGSRPPSFLHVVGNRLPRGDGDNSKVSLYISMCSCELSEGKSWMSFNGWPTTRSLQPHEKLIWSPEIPLGVGFGQWDVVLLSMDFWACGRDNQFYQLKDGHIDFANGDGIPVSLDTGCSVSWVPPSLVHFIRTRIFPTADNLQRHEDQRDIEQSYDTTLLPYTVPLTAYTVPGTQEQIPFDHLNSWYISYKFRGAQDNSPITVQGPLVPFICAQNPGHPNAEREGLLFPSAYEKEAPGRYIFGVNFFQSMYVQFGYSPHAADRYVKLAPQWVPHRERYGLPPQ